MNKILIKLDEKEVEVAKIPIGRYPELIKTFQGIFSEVSKWEKIDNATLFANLPDLISNHLPEAYQLISVATSLNKEEVQNLGLAELVDLVIGVIEVNKFVAIYEKIKKGVAHPGQ